MDFLLAARWVCWSSAKAFTRMPARNCGYGAGATLAHQVPGKQVRLRRAVRPGALYKRPAFNRWSMIERKLDKALKNQVEMQQDMRAMTQDMHAMTQDMHAMTQDMRAMTQDMRGMTQDMRAMTQDIGDMKQDIGGMKQGIGGMKQGNGGMQQDIGGGMTQNISRMKQDMAWMNKALIVVHLTPLALLVLGVLYFMASGGGSN